MGMRAVITFNRDEENRQYHTAPKVARTTTVQWGVYATTTHRTAICGVMNILAHDHPERTVRDLFRDACHVFYDMITSRYEHIGSVDARPVGSPQFWLYPEVREESVALCPFTRVYGESEDTPGVVTIGGLCPRESGYDQPFPAADTKAAARDMVMDHPHAQDGVSALYDEVNAADEVWFYGDSIRKGHDDVFSVEDAAGFLGLGADMVDEAYEVAVKAAV